MGLTLGAERPGALGGRPSSIRLDSVAPLKMDSRPLPELFGGSNRFADVKMFCKRQHAQQEEHICSETWNPKRRRYRNHDSTATGSMFCLLPIGVSRPL